MLQMLLQHSQGPKMIVYILQSVYNSGVNGQIKDGA